MDVAFVHTPIEDAGNLVCVEITTIPLCSDEAAFTTGAVLVVDGGQTA